MYETLTDDTATRYPLEMSLSIRGMTEAQAGTASRDCGEKPNQLRVDLFESTFQPFHNRWAGFDYRKEFSKLDYSALKGDLKGAADRFTTVVAGP